MRSNTKLPGKLEDKGRDPKEDTRQTLEEGTMNILKKRGIEWKGLRAVHRDHETS